MKKYVIIATLVVVAALIFWQAVGRGEKETSSTYEFAEVERGDIENIVSSTGTLDAVGTVEVGTQVSGIISNIFVDFNEPVHAGQVLAVLDTTMLSASVRDARAGVIRAQALYDQATRDYDREEELHANDLVSDAELSDSQTIVETSRAALLSAQASLDRSRANLKYAVIKSPVSGKVIMRNVEPGQTVAASFSTPTLFLIADDLSKMEIHALVDESDIGQIRVGQSVRFTVEAYIDEVFDGVVRQIWLQPETISNVVMYTVVVAASNDRGLLYPGMTATTDFLVDERHDVLIVPNAALMLKATPRMFAEMRQTTDERMAELPDSVRQALQARMASRRGAATEAGSSSAAAAGTRTQGSTGASGSGNGFGEEGSAFLWYLDDHGRLNATRVTKGVTDGRNTEIVKGRDVKEGMQVITRVNEPEQQNGSSNPLVTGPFGRRG
ncbi:MAG: efflux RND transporter periplasmic adaptor subunit [Candidatus Eisenbacteria bacterium]|nr:efflux RND transporter periplasmic adaptor subunit [Candidatus Eisenbacteria bacterium]